MSQTTDPGELYFYAEPKVNKIINSKQSVEIAKKINRSGKKIVIAGGIFDILHIGHIRFLQQAKNEGDLLFVFLESDNKAKQTKGKLRPINDQKTRAEVLESLYFVDYVVTLDNNLEDKQYDKLISQIKPTIIAVTKGSSTMQHAKRQAIENNIKVIEVITRIQNQSTTRIAKIISKSL